MEKLHGCLRKGTLILLKNRQKRPIEKIKKGDVVVVFDEDKKKFKTSIVENLIIQESDLRLSWMEIVLDNTTRIICTVNHLFLTDRGWVSAENLKLSDILVSY